MMRHFHRLQPRRWGFGRALPLLPALSPPFGDAPQFCGKTDEVRAEPPAAFSGVAARFRQRAERERSRSFVGPSVFAPPPQPAGQDGKNRLPPLLPPPSEIGAKACPLPRSACADRGLFSAGLNAHASERGRARHQTMPPCAFRLRHQMQGFSAAPGPVTNDERREPKLEGRFRPVMLPLFRAAHGRCGATPEDGFAGVPRLLRKKQPKKRRAMTMTRAKTGIRVTKKAEPSGAFPMHPGIGTQKQAGPAALPSRDVSL